MKFIDVIHERFYNEFLSRMDNYDVYHRIFAYLITLDNSCRYHINDLYDFDECHLKSDPLDHAWQTGTSRRTTALAYNLYTNSTLWCEDDPSCCSVSDIMCCEYAPYYCEAIKIRYPEYFQGIDC